MATDRFFFPILFIFIVICFVTYWHIYLLIYSFTFCCVLTLLICCPQKKIIIIIINWHILVDHDDIRRVTTVKKKAGTDNNNNPRWFAQRQSATAVNSFLKNSVFSPFFQASPAKTKGIDLGSEYWTTAIFKVFCSQNFKSSLL